LGGEILLKTKHTLLLILQGFPSAWLVASPVGVVVASLVGGAMQPYMFKDLKYD
jgi:hypothetical protein